MTSILNVACVWLVPALGNRRMDRVGEIGKREEDINERGIAVLEILETKQGGLIIHAYLLRHTSSSTYFR